MSEEPTPALRVSDAERDERILRLREAMAEGRLTLEEFSDRVHTREPLRSRRAALLDRPSADRELPPPGLTTP